MRLMGDAEVVLNSSDSNKFFGSCLDQIRSVVGAYGFRYAKNRECVHESNDGFDGCFVLDCVQHDKSGSLILHDQDLSGLSEGAWSGDGHEVDVPTAEDRGAGKNGFVHCVRMFLLEPETLAVRACGNETCDVDEASGPVEASSLEFADRFITAVMTCCTTVASADVVNVFR